LDWAAAIEAAASAEATAALADRSLGLALALRGASSGRFSGSGVTFSAAAAAPCSLLEA
jgi:hypothetical protein